MALTDPNDRDRETPRHGSVVVLREVPCTQFVEQQNRRTNWTEIREREMERTKEEVTENVQPFPTCSSKSSCQLDLPTKGVNAVMGGSFLISCRGRVSIRGAKHSSRPTQVPTISSYLPYMFVIPSLLVKVSAPHS